MNCTLGEAIPKEDWIGVASAVLNVTQKEVESKYSFIFNINATVINALCAASRRRDLVENVRAETGFDHRRLPKSSSAIDFSGEFCWSLSNRHNAMSGEICPLTFSLSIFYSCHYRRV